MGGREGGVKRERERKKERRKETKKQRSIAGFVVCFDSHGNCSVDS